MDIKKADITIIAFLKRSFLPIARFSIFLIYFWFGIIKVFNLSPATPLAKALVHKTVGDALFDPLFISLAFLECIIGILFLIPRATRVVIPLLFLHLLVVCAPLVILPSITWQQPFVPTLEGQYIIKNIVVIAIAIGIAASTVPLRHKKLSR